MWIAFVIGLLGLTWVWLERRRFKKLEARSQSLELEVANLKRQAVDFVANVSHELKTPLTSIKGFSETLRALIKKDPEKSLEFLTRIEENTDRLVHFINDTLELSRIEQPNFYIEKSEFEVEPLLKEIEKKFLYTLGGRKQVLVLQTEQKLLKADPWLVDQAISNLIENAHRYSPEGALIEVKVKPGSLSGTVEISVSDTGPGIGPEDLPRIFEKFYRVDKSRSRALGGTGLGLAIVKHIMLSHGGDVRVESQLGQGSRFLLIFPNQPS